ncbi:MAG: hypothetical protein HKM05_02635 [Spirochaetales bacterium]|nr:hypothetical protein [Spirochaetales bacterium]
MPAIDAIEHFKSQIQALAGENALRVAQGLAPEEIAPPQALGESLEDLLGSMPLANSTSSDVEAPESLEPLEELEPPVDDGLGDLFDTPLPDASGSELADLDALLGPAKTDTVEAEELPEPEEPSEPSAESLALRNLDALLAEDDFGVPVEITTPPSKASGGIEDFDEALFDEAAFDQGSSADDFNFEATDFSELSGFAETKEEDVEAFDEKGEADEFPLGDFETQFGITAFDHYDNDVLNPATEIDLEIEAAQKNLSLSEEEFAALQQTLARQPLDLKLAIEELIGEKEVTLEDLTKVVTLLTGGASTRALAVAVGKILGRKISVPTGYEKGSGEALEAQRASLWYNIRTVTGPIFQISVVATVAAALLILLFWNFLWRPFRAEDLYNRGLAEIRADHSRQADEFFDQAYYYWPAQDRFFQYARAFEDVGDYARAQRKYLELLQPSIKPEADADRKALEDRFSLLFKPLPSGLEGAALEQKLAEKRLAARQFYVLVLKLLAEDPNHPSSYTTKLRGKLIFLNPNRKGLLEYSRFETWYGDDGLDPNAHFRRAKNLLKPLFALNPYDKEALLRKGDNAMVWAQKLNSREHYREADQAFSDYRQKYGEDWVILWRFVRLFIQTDQEPQLLHFRDRLLQDPHAQFDPEGAAQLARWLINRHIARDRAQQRVVPRQRTIEEEYRISSYDNWPAGPQPQPVIVEPSDSTAQNLRQEESGSSKPVNLPPPHPYALSNILYQPHYLKGVDTILIKALAVRKNLPEIHEQLARYYRLVWNFTEEKKALAASDAYFEQMPAREQRRYDRWGGEIQVLDRIGEIFVQENEPLQAESYYVNALRRYQEGLYQKLLSPEISYAKVYADLADLYYAQTPGTKNSPDPSMKGGWDRALDLYQKAEQMGLATSEITYRIGVINYEKKNYQQAVLSFLKIEESPQGEDNDNLLYALGNALFRTGNYALADGYYRSLKERLEIKRHTIRNLDLRKRKSHRYLIQRLVEVENNLAAAIDRGRPGLRVRTGTFAEALKYLTEAQAIETSLGFDLYDNHQELDITEIDDQALQKIRAQEAQIVRKTRQVGGLIAANLKLLSLAQSSPPQDRIRLSQALEIFPRLPLTLSQQTPW